MTVLSLELIDAEEKYFLERTIMENRESRSNRWTRRQSSTAGQGRAGQGQVYRETDGQRLPSYQRSLELPRVKFGRFVVQIQIVPSSCIVRFMRGIYCRQQQDSSLKALELTIIDLPRAP